MKYTIIAVCLVIAGIVSSCRHTAKNDNSNAGTNDSILSVLNASIEKDARDPALYLKRAEYYLVQEKINDALADVNKALELDPDNKQGTISLSSIYILMGKPQQALEILNKAIAKDPAFIGAYLKKAKLCLVMKDYNGCAEAVQKVFEMEPHNAEAFYLKGVALDENNQPSKAVEAFQQAVLYNPRHYDALIQLGYASSKTNIRMAIDYFNNALKAMPNSPEALYNLGMLYQENDQPEKALNLYADMLKINPYNKLALYNSGYVNLVYLTNYKAGYDFFTRALEVDSAYTDAYYNRGYCSELSGEFENARQDYKKVLQLKVNDEKAIQGLNRLDKIRRK
jgi:tetratricopeptide (TPR) repeat protein